jgi:dipeptidyl aminopeptidase/acylaminoacyl peptidase
MPADGPGEPRAIVEDLDVEGPVWSPDGSSIAFAAKAPGPDDEEKDEKKRRPRRITRLRHRLDNDGWTYDRPHHIHVVGVDGGEPRRLTDGEHGETAPTWSPDGRRLAFVGCYDEDWDLRVVSDVHVIDATHDGEGFPEPRRLSGADGDAASPSWSPDGARIAYLHVPGVFDEPRHGVLKIVDVETGEQTAPVTSLDRNCLPYPPLREPVWTADGRELFFAFEDEGNVPLHRTAWDGNGTGEPVATGDFGLGGYDAAGDVVVTARSTPTSMFELFVGQRQVTDVGRAFVDGRELVAPEAFPATSADGTSVPAWIVRPVGLADGERVPAVLCIHGGPFTQYGNRFFDEFQVYAAAGYAVIYSNPRGSSGYGEAWGRAIRGPGEHGPGWGSVDYADVMAVMDEALRRFDFIDPDRLGVMGGSYGGYMTSWIVGHTDRFRCAISERACNDLALLDGTSDFAGMFKGSIGPYPWEDPQLYRWISPITYATNITTPTLILHSENDLRCPISQAEVLFTTLRALKREVEFVRFPAESHELSRSGSPLHREMRFEVVLDWLDRHLKDRDAAVV